MRILYLGDFKEFYSTELYIAHALEALGHTVYKAQEQNVTDARLALNAALTYKVDFVLLSKGSFQQAHQTVDLLRKHGIITVGWIFDLFFDVPLFFGRRVLTNATFKADICCMTDGGHLDKWRENGVRYRLLRQGIHEPDAHYGEKQPKHPEIVFIGTYSYAERIALVDWLRATYGKNFRHYGRGGDVRETRGKALNNVLASAKIVVGDSMPCPNYWSNRIYEITGRGGFLLHPHVEGLDTEYKDGVHYAGYTFGDFKELKTKIDYYLAHDKEREEIRKAGHEHTKKNYTYTKRCAQLIEYVKSYKQTHKA